MTAAVYLAAILAILPVPAFELELITQDQEKLAIQAEEAAAASDVPVSTLLVIGFLETHLGRSEHGCGWGTPVDRNRCRTMDSPLGAARALARGYRRCGDTLGAITHFRTGHCRFSRTLIGYEPSDAVMLLERVVASAAQMESEEQDAQ